MFYSRCIYYCRHIFAISRLLLAVMLLSPPQKPQIQCFVICFFCELSQHFLLFPLCFIQLPFFCALLQHFSYLLVFSKVTALSRPPWLTSSFDTFYYKCLNQTFLQIRNECELTESISITNKARTSIPVSMTVEKMSWWGNLPQLFTPLLMLSSTSNTI